MKASTIAGLVVVVLVVLGGIYWYVEQNSGVSTQTAAQSAEQTAPVATSTATLALGTSASLGNYLETPSGMSLYTYQNDTSGTSTCVDDCATAWPPYTVPSPDGLTASDPTIAGTIGTITRADGTLQVTYNGMPLYMYAANMNPGDTSGDGVGGLWSIARP